MITTAYSDSSSGGIDRAPSRVELSVHFGGHWTVRGDVGRRLARRLRGFQVSVAIAQGTVVLRRPNRGIPPSLCQGICDWLRDQPEVAAVDPVVLQSWS